MYELIQVAANSYYIQSPAKIGLIKLSGDDVCLIDSGNDKDAGRKVRQILDANGWHLTAIYNTHSNADHIGGNQYLQKQTGCKIYAPGIDCDFTCHPKMYPVIWTLDRCTNPKVWTQVGAWAGNQSARQVY